VPKEKEQRRQCNPGAEGSRTGGEPAVVRCAAPGAKIEQEMNIDDLIQKNALHTTMADLLKNAAAKSGLVDFLNAVIQGEVVPAMCQSEARVDHARYWEKRHVQNKLRRLLESLQEYLGLLDGDTRPVEIGRAAFGKILSKAQHLGQQRAPDGRRRGSARPAVGLSELAFAQALTELGIWPEDLNNADRAEVFVALLASTGAVVRAYHAGQSMADEMTMRIFCEGLSRVPFNIPDYPVPTHLVKDAIVPGVPKPHEQRVLDVAEVVAKIFAQDSALLDAKDFFLCGLLSVEEIQAALPRLVRISLVEEAAKLICREGLQRFTHAEWRKFIIPVRFPEDAAAAATTADQPAESAFEEPSNVDDSAGTNDAEEVLLGERPAAVDGTRGDAFQSHGNAPVYQNMDVSASVDPATAVDRQSIAAQRYLINWRSSNASGIPNGHRDSDAEIMGHQADEGAGKVNTALGPQGRSLNQNDFLCYISLEMHSECTGPFLARAFVRCCTLYEAAFCG